MAAWGLELGLAQSPFDEQGLATVALETYENTLLLAVVWAIDLEKEGPSHCEIT